MRADRAELSRTVAELAGRLDVKGRIRQRAASARERAGSAPVSGLGDRVRRPVLDGLERTLRWVADGLHRLGTRLRGPTSTRAPGPGDPGTSRDEAAVQAGRLPAGRGGGAVRRAPCSSGYGTWPRETTTRPTHGRGPAAWGEILAAAALQGIIFAVVKAAARPWWGRGVRKLTGQWPA